MKLPKRNQNLYDLCNFQLARSYHHDGTCCMWKLPIYHSPPKTTQIMIGSFLKHSDCIMADNMIDLTLHGYLSSPSRHHPFISIKCMDTRGASDTVGVFEMGFDSHKCQK